MLASLAAHSGGMQWYCLVVGTGSTVARFAYSDPIEPEDEWEDPALLLRLMRAGCPITDVGTAEIDACIEVHFDDETTPWRVLAITPGTPSAVELHGEAASLALHALL